MAKKKRVKKNNIKQNVEPPASKWGWLEDRLSNDTWFFGLRKVGGEIICIQSVNKVYDNNFADVMFMDQKWAEESFGHFGKVVGCPHDDRAYGTVNLNNVVAAYELANT